MFPIFIRDSFCFPPRTLSPHNPKIEVDFIYFNILKVGPVTLILYDYNHPPSVL